MTCKVSAHSRGAVKTWDPPEHEPQMKFLRVDSIPNTSTFEQQMWGIFWFICGLIIIGVFSLISNTNMVHTLFGEQLWHDISSMGIVAGLLASGTGIFYFAIQKAIEISTSKAEFKEFKEDLLESVDSLVDENTKECHISRKEGKVEISPSHNFQFNVFTLYNNKYRDRFTKKERKLIDMLNQTVNMANKLGIDIHEISTKESKTQQQLEHLVNSYNYQLRNLKKHRELLLELLQKKKKNLFKRIFRKITFSNTHS